eukprot:9521818-Karenia_brevis.AAC.1
MEQRLDDAVKDVDKLTQSLGQAVQDFLNKRVQQWKARSSKSTLFSEKRGLNTIQMQRSLDVLSHGFLLQLLGIFSDRVDDLLYKGVKISEWTCDNEDVPAPLAMPRRSSRV